MKNLYKLGLAGILCSALIGFTMPAFAQEAAAPIAAPAAEEGAISNFFKSVEVSGFIDTFYSYNFSEPKDNLGSGGDFVRPDFLEVRAFDREHNSFTLNNIEISVYKPSTEKDPIGFGFTTLFGEQARRLTFIPAEMTTNTRVDDDDFTVGQGFVTYKAPIGKGLDFKFGKFATWIGAELWESVDNPNYSRSFMYQSAIPFTHTGLAVSYPLLDNLTATGYLVNGWDTFVDNNDAKTLGYQFIWAIAENTSFIVNGSHGAEQDEDLVKGADSNMRHFWDLILALKPLEKTAFNLNFDFATEEEGAMSAGNFVAGHGTGQYWGFAGIIIQDITDSVGVAFRGEYFDDSDGTRLGVDDLQLWGVTFTTNIKIRENLLVRPEIRYDDAGGKEVFAGQDNQLTTSIAVAYLF
ncbi:MAG: outer membrane beta-barrel protein [Candidatus Brocadiales bacterium]|nr:outer membrane beta-barrel protein [Candidatus Brocadiales bacterium]